jgi:hypothetical protein
MALNYEIRTPNLGVEIGGFHPHSPSNLWG